MIWLQLICLAGNTNDGGQIYFTPEVPYTEQMLSTAFGEPLATVQLALRTFEAFGMVEIVNDVICLPNWEKYQAVEGMEKIRENNRIRQRKHREKMLIEKNDLKTCAYCGEVATGVDHIVPRARGGADTDDNVVPCCIRCNRAKNDKPLPYFLNVIGKDYINKDRVMNNGKLSKYVFYDGSKFIENECHVTPCDMSHDVMPQNKNKKENKSKDITYMRFTPPTLDEVKTYVASRGNRIDAQRFYDYYEAAGWKDSSGKSVKNWKQKAITWENHSPTAKPKLPDFENPYKEEKREEPTMTPEEAKEWYDNLIKELQNEKN